MLVMAVDDDLVSRLALIDLLQRAGYTDIIEFEDGKDAWGYLQKGPMPVLICCDVRMPNMSGIEVLQNVRKDQRLAQLPFLLITSGSEREVVHKAIVLGVSGYIVKPFNRATALEKLSEVFDKAYKGIAEKPQATGLRLAISNEKLLEYYQAFHVQVADFIKYLKSSPTKDYKESIQEQFTAINQGCLTLGLWHSSKQLERLATLEIEQEASIDYLEPIISTIKYQINQVSP
jgi:two-component system chemotaxis response regulator CheY